MVETRLLVLALVGLSLAPFQYSSAATISEDFTHEPTTQGWNIFGDTNLFVWDASNQVLQVTWDSSQTNSYFYRPLGTILSKADDFGFTFDLRLSDIRTNLKSGPFEIAVGFMNFADETSTNFWRGSGVDPVHGPRNLVEFDYFPAGYYPGFGGVAASISPTVISGANAFDSGFDLLELTTNDLFHISLTYTASNQTLHTTITRNGGLFGPVDDVVLDTNFTDFRANAFAISSYSDFGDDFDSVLGHGSIDNVVINIPSPPITNIYANPNNGVWQVQFGSSSNWMYTLERTIDYQSWNAASAPLIGNGETLVLAETNLAGPKAFYRVRADR
jgi:hypothetical protein